MHPRPHRPEEGCGQGPLGNRRAQAARADRSRRDLGPLDRHGSGAGRGVRVARRRARPRRLLPFRELRAAARGGAAGPRRAGAPRWRRGRAGAGGRGRRDDRPRRTLDRARAGDAVRPAQDRGGLGRLPRAPRGPARPGSGRGRLAPERAEGRARARHARARRAAGRVATRTAAGGWRLTGRKIYVTGAPILAWYLVWARTDEPVPRVGQFLVPAGGPGTRVEPTWDHLGLRASGSHDVLLEGVEVPEDHAVGLRRPE